MLVIAFGFGRSKRLQTWARPCDDLNGPHWIGVRNGSVWRADRGHRYTHHLVVRNDGWRLTGAAMQHDDPWIPGTVFCCDTHSPHILLREDGGKGMFYLAASIDSTTPLSLEQTLPRLLDFVRRHL